MKTHYQNYLKMLAAAILLFISMIFAEDMIALEIMKKVEDRDTGDNKKSEMQMILIDKNGHKRIRYMISFVKKKSGVDQSIIFFQEPADVKGTSFLTYDYEAPDQDDDQWMYLPALKKIKRIAAADKSGSFMGSDFNYSDMDQKDINDFDYKLMGEREINGFKTWVIQSTPKNQKVISETGYSKGIVFVRQDNFMVIRAVQYVDGNEGKMKYLDIKEVKEINGIWTAIELEMKTKLGKETLHTTIIKNSNIQFNRKIEDDIFTQQNMKKGL